MELDRLLRKHDGVITLAQARSAGLSQDAIDRRVRSGHWRRCAPGVYFAEDHVFTDSARIRAMVWTYGHGAVASGLAAAHWHGIVVKAPDLVEVTVERHRRLRQRPGSKLRRRDIRAADIVERRGLLVTSLDLTAVEAAARHGGGPAVMDVALQRHTELSQLWRAHLRHRGRHGSPRARMLLQAAGDNTHSKAERLLVEILKRASIVGWVANYRVGSFVVDVAFPQKRVVIEVDGWAFHSDVSAFQHDRARQNYLVRHGWQVLRFTWRDLVDDPDRVGAEIRAVCGV